VNSRCCSRTACKQPPVYTLTYVYKDSTAVLGPLAGYVDPHSWDLCEMHAARLVVPRGWDVVRLPPDPAQERADDLEALANVVKHADAESASVTVRTLLFMTHVRMVGTPTATKMAKMLMVTTISIRVKPRTCRERLISIRPSSSPRRWGNSEMLTELAAPPLSSQRRFDSR